MFSAIAKKLSNMMVYQDQEDRKDCINYAIMDCILCWENFDTEKSKNPFAYFT